MARFNKLSYYVSKNLDHVHSSDARKHYEILCRQFDGWVYEQYGTHRINPAEFTALGQRYLDYRASIGKAADTVYADRVALTMGLGVPASDFHIAKRGAPTKGRDVGHRTATNARVYDIAPKVGIRLDEYGQLRGNSFRERDGHLFVHVPKGKGGKEQWQLINDKYKDEVRELFNGNPKEFVFTKAEIRGAARAGTHDARRQNAREMYEYFRTCPESEKEYWRAEVRQRFAMNPKKVERESYEKYVSRLSTTPTIWVRGTNRERCEERGIEPCFDREAVMMTSVLCLSHYREDVTVTNYLI